MAPNYRLLRGALCPCLPTAVGIALALDGLQNGWITAYTVRVRARKKHLTEHFGLDEEQDETSD